MTFCLEINGTTTSIFDFTDINDKLRNLSTFQDASRIE